ncbi:hypothetical protein [Sphingosinicella sp. BN140058]|uniref:hypothetical protein n=1 Tax=Sphingosinicella sp. BN140058 TaxID=1892855 RepID=UPI001010F11D|nr:hypothetical protein [Sphingosinicella sp. BN140058]QAY77964.1 hypothetical protein ETR14_16610 [Sphingosinicella sp. BN140058]
MALGKIVMAGFALGGLYVAMPRGRADPALLLPQPMKVSVERLRASRRVVEGTGMGSLTVAGAGAAGGALLIGVSRAGDPHRVTCRVAITPASPTTSRAEVDCDQTASKDEPTRRVAVKAMALVVREHVAATVEDRPYDIDGVANRMIALLAVNRAAVAASLQPEG